MTMIHFELRRHSQAARTDMRLKFGSGRAGSVFALVRRGPHDSRAPCSFRNGSSCRDHWRATSSRTYPAETSEAGRSEPGDDDTDARFDRSAPSRPPRSHLDGSPDAILIGDRAGIVQYSPVQPVRSRCSPRLPALVDHRPKPSFHIEMSRFVLQRCGNASSVVLATFRGNWLCSQQATRRGDCDDDQPGRR